MEIITNANFRYAKIQRRDLICLPYWVVVLYSESAVMRYLQDVKSRQIYSALKDAKEAVRGTMHFTPEAFAVNMTLAASDASGIKRNSVIDDLLILGEKFNTPYLTVFLKYGALYVNNKGGFFPAQKVEHEILETKETEEFEFPNEPVDEKEIKISQWQGGGMHYYAKIGDADVVVHGEQKWDTWDEAMNAAKDFIQGSPKN